jgi:hypothetical protein
MEVVPVSPPLSPFARVAQLAYVTNDFDWGLQALRERYGIREMLQLRDQAVEVQPQRHATLHIGLALAGEMQVELIEPRGGEDRVYRAEMPLGAPALHFHHIAELFETEEMLLAAEADYSRKGVAIAIRGSVPGMMRYFYTDHRAALGHFIEHAYYTIEGRQFLATLPRA